MHEVPGWLAKKSQAIQDDIEHRRNGQAFPGRQGRVGEKTFKLKYSSLK
jgi:hypothetical protein